MKRLIGCFYLKIDNNGNLTGEFTNAETDQILQHSATSNGEIKDRIIGNYNAQWIDINGQSYTSTLAITNKNNKVIFVWSVNDSPIYEGQGMIVDNDNMVIGHYKKLRPQKT